MWLNNFITSYFYHVYLNFFSSALLPRASNRLKYRYDLGSGSAKFIFSGLSAVQVFRRLILKVKFRLKFKIL